MEQERQPTESSAGVEPSDSQQKDTKGAEETPQPPSPNALKVAATECLNSWIYYLQMLNSLCSAGVRLSHSLYNLAQSQNVPLATQCQSSWEELAKATTYASHTVKAHIAAAMQDMVIGETFTDYDAQRQQEHNQQIIAENLLTFVNLQYQFSIASCECMGPMAMCPSCQTTPGGQHDPECSMAALQQCFAQFYSLEARSRVPSPHFPIDRATLDSPKGPEVTKTHPEYPRQHSPINPSCEPRGSSPYQEPFRGPSPIHGFAGHMEIIRGPFPNPGQLHTMKSPFPIRGSRSPLHFPLFPLAGQRRWSEAAAGDVSGESSDSTMRRWSMPWDCGRVEAAPWQQRYFPSKLAVPGTGVSQDRSRSTTPESGVPQSGTIASGEGLAEAIQLLSCRPMRCAIPHGPLSAQLMQPIGAASWTDTHEERMPRRMFPGPLQRGIWQSVDVPHSSGMSVTEHYDIFPPVIPLTSRKSSSSTDSSSCLSIHSRSTTSSSERGSDGVNSGGEAVRLHTNLYSIWSGSDHLPFIRLPESQEPQDDSDTENTPTDQFGQPVFPKPS